MLGMGEVSLRAPGLHLGAGLILGDCACLEPILDPAQAVVGAVHIGFRHPTPAIGVKLIAQECRRLCGRQDHGLARVQLKSAPRQKGVDPNAPFLQLIGAIPENSVRPEGA
jgi:hypothetical protein